MFCESSIFYCSRKSNTSFTILAIQVFFFFTSFSPARKTLPSAVFPHTHRSRSVTLRPSAALLFVHSPVVRTSVSSFLFSFLFLLSNCKIIVLMGCCLTASFKFAFDLNFFAMVGSFDRLEQGSFVQISVILIGSFKLWSTW